jgi:predicted membrane-bound spermidine synthase
MTEWSDVAGGCAYFEEDCAAYELEKALKRAGMKAKLKHVEVDDFGEWLVSANWPYAAALRR